jgi:predicted nucleic acid-binding protein
MRIYLDTSVPSTYFDDRTPDRQQATRSFWEHASAKREIFISELVLAEIKRTPLDAKRQSMINLVEPLPRLEMSAEVLRLARCLYEANLVPANKFDDALHLGHAAVAGVDVLISWNFRHMVNLKVKQKLPVILAEQMYFRQFQLISPFEYSEA